MKPPKDNHNKPAGKVNKKKPAAASKPKSFGSLGASASMGAQPSPMLNSPFNMQGMQ